MNQNRGEVRSGVADVEIDDNLEFCGHGRFLSIIAARPKTFRRPAPETLGRGLCLISVRVVWHDSLLFVGVVPGDDARL